MADVVTIRGIWSGASDELAATILGEVKQDTPDLYREALAGAANAMRMRPQVLRQQPVARQSATIRRALTQVGFDELGARLLIDWLTKRQQPMLTQFLDELGIAHEEGTIKEEIGPQPEAERLSTAVQHLRDAFPPEHVRIYLSAFYLLTAYDWDALPALIEG